EYGEGKGNQVFAINVDSCNSGDCSVSVIAGRSGVADVIDGTGRDVSVGGEGTAAFENITSMVHDPVSDTLYVGVSVDCVMPCCLLPPVNPPCKKKKQ
ncbi:hypothetical protein DUNSADRAFT_11829, partial [Dunaliella salina]